MDDSTGVILDCGTTLCRAGLSDSSQESPQIVIPNVVGRSRLKSPHTANTHFIGDSALALSRDEFQIRYPMDYGHVTNWDEMQLVWQDLIDDKLKIQPADHPFLLVQPCNAPSGNLERTAQIFFEVFGVPSLRLMPSGELSLMASSIDTGVAVEIGGGACFCVPVVNGYGLRHLQQRTEFSGRDLTYTLSKMLTDNIDSGRNDGNSIPLDIVNTIKEKYCYCVKDYAEECNLFSKEKEIVHNFTDVTGECRSIKIGVEQFQCPESLFKPGLAKKEFPGLHEIVLKCLMVDDDDLKNKLASNIVVCGGSALFPGLAPRLQHELEVLSESQEYRKHINVCLSPFRHAAYQGGRVAAQVENLWNLVGMSKENYDENGPFGITKMFRH